MPTEFEHYANIKQKFYNETINKDSVITYKDSGKVFINHIDFIDKMGFDYTAMNIKEIISWSKYDTDYIFEYVFEYSSNCIKWKKK